QHHRGRRGAGHRARRRTGDPRRRRQHRPGPGRPRRGRADGHRTDRLHRRHTPDLHLGRGDRAAGRPAGLVPAPGAGQPGRGFTRGSTGGGPPGPGITGRSGGQTHQLHVFTHPPRGNHRVGLGRGGPPQTTGPIVPHREGPPLLHPHRHQASVLGMGTHIAPQGHTAGHHTRVRAACHGSDQGDQERECAHQGGPRVSRKSHHGPVTGPGQQLGVSGPAGNPVHHHVRALLRQDLTHVIGRPPRGGTAHRDHVHVRPPQHLRQLRTPVPQAHGVLQLRTRPGEHTRHHRADGITHQPLPRQARHGHLLARDHHRNTREHHRKRVVPQARGQPHHGRAQDVTTRENDLTGGDLFPGPAHVPSRPTLTFHHTVGGTGPLVGKDGLGVLRHPRPRGDLHGLPRTQPGTHFLRGPGHPAPHQPPGALPGNGEAVHRRRVERRKPGQGPHVGSQDPTRHLIQGQLTRVRGQLLPQCPRTFTRPPPRKMSLTSATTPGSFVLPVHVHLPVVRAGRGHSPPPPWPHHTPSPARPVGPFARPARCLLPPVLPPLPVVRRCPPPPPPPPCPNPFPPPARPVGPFARPEHLDNMPAKAPSHVDEPCPPRMGAPYPDLPSGDFPIKSYQQHGEHGRTARPVQTADSKRTSLSW